MKRPNRTIGYILIIIVGLGAIMWGANYWVTSRIKSALDQKVEAGNLSYESLSVNIYSNRASLHQVRWVQEKSGTPSNIWSLSQVGVSGFGVIKYLFHHEITLDRIIITTPDVTLYKQTSDTLEQHPKPEEFLGAPPKLFIKQLEITDGRIQILEKDSTQSILTAQVPFLQMDAIRMDSTTRDHPIPFAYTGYAFSGHSIDYRMSELYNLKVKHMESGGDQLVLDSLEIVSPYDKLEFQAHIPFEKAWVNLLIPKVELVNPEIGYHTDTIGISATTANLHRANLDIYKDNRQPHNPIFKPLYSRMLRQLPIKLAMDSVKIMDADINFQVRTTEEPPPGIVYFRNVNGTISHLNNTGMGEPDFQETTVYATTKFMDKADFELNWSFDIRDSRDAFLVSGNLSRITDHEINYFVTPTINIETVGAINQLAFNFAGNNDAATGDTYLDYDALRIYLLKKDGSARHRWISGIINFILNHRLDGPVEEKGLTVERVQTKSFWHFLWAMVREGSLETVK